MSADGQRLATASDWYTSTGNDARSFNGGNGAGRVDVFKLEGGVWNTIGDPFIGEAGDDTGSGVALSQDGKRIVIASKGVSSSQGRVQVFEESNGTWTQLGGNLEGASANVNFGYAVAMSYDGSRVAVTTKGDGTGSVQVFDLVGNDWVQVGSTLSGTSVYDEFGWALDLSADGSRLIVGAPYADVDSKQSVGYVRVFEYRDGAWGQMGGDLTDSTELDNYGYDVSMSGDGSGIAIGVPESGMLRNDPYTEGSYDGRVHRFDWNGTQWTNVGTLSDDSAGGFGYAISLSYGGGRLAVGAPFKSYPSGGFFKIYERATTSWNEVATKTYTGIFGVDLSMAALATRVVVSASRTDVEGVAWAGKARVFDRLALLPEVQLTISYDSGGGSVATGGDTSTTIGGSIGTLPETPTRSGYSFNGWYTATSGGTRITAGSAHGQFSNFTLYAQWTASSVASPNPPAAAPPPPTTAPPTTIPTTPTDPVLFSGVGPTLDPGTGEILEGDSWDEVSARSSEVMSELVRDDNEVVLQPVNDDGSPVVDDDFEIRLSGDCSGADCSIETITDTNGRSREVMHLQTVDGQARATGSGFQPGTEVRLWLFSEPTSLGTAIVAADGTFAVVVPLDGVMPGEHTLQANGVTSDSKVRTAHVGVVLDPAEIELPVTGGSTSLVMWALWSAVFGFLIVLARRRPDETTA